jgi:hypothetical protein
MSLPRNTSWLVKVTKKTEEFRAAFQRILLDIGKIENRAGAIANGNISQ